MSSVPLPLDPLPEPEPLDDELLDDPQATAPSAVSPTRQVVPTMRRTFTSSPLLDF